MSAPQLSGPPCGVLSNCNITVPQNEQGLIYLTPEGVWQNAFCLVYPQNITNVQTGDVITWNGTEWVNDDTVYAHNGGYTPTFNFINSTNGGVTFTTPNSASWILIGGTPGKSIPVAGGTMMVFMTFTLAPETTGLDLLISLPETTSVLVAASTSTQALHGTCTFIQSGGTSQGVFFVENVVGEGPTYDDGTQIRVTSNVGLNTADTYNVQLAIAYPNNTQTS